MRKLILLVMVIISLAAKAQFQPAMGFMQYIHQGNLSNTLYNIANTPNKKWFVTTYSGITASYSIFNGGGASVIAAPVGLQLNRRINNNLYAFAGVSVAPMYVNFTNTYLNTTFNKAYQSNGMFNANNFGAYSRVEMGLMYVNDARTFSISGSVGVERSSYPVMPYRQPNPTKTYNTTQIHH